MYRSLRNESEDPNPQRNERTRILLKGTNLLKRTNPLLVKDSDSPSDSFSNSLNEMDSPSDSSSNFLNEMDSPFQSERDLLWVGLRKASCL
ncbi:hypothetical protein AVEN_16894-1 [Araneus ventricosus]|uniref:Uncharacterized protein n=1 Tax=Araneus ventricosus TaxID=182803 RepID=A0A4Y2DSY3_ARAVE|nr:hypothetical protein AVEN_16894-1 [Araneus ventricosus]